MTYEISVTIRYDAYGRVKRIPRVMVCKTLEEARQSFDELCARNRYVKVELEEVKPLKQWKRDPNWKPAPYAPAVK